MDLHIPASQLNAWRDHPAKGVIDLFGVVPDRWQENVLEAFPHQQQIAMQACKGPGKTAVLAWIGWNFLLTRPYPMIGATSVSGDNLRSNLWTELARWYQKAPLLQGLFEFHKTQIFLREAPEVWKLEARTWAKDADAAAIGNALAGLHADYVMWLSDEVGDYPLGVLNNLQGIFAGAPKEAHIVMAGNPTNPQLDALLYFVATRARSRWHVVEITADPDDPNRTPRVSVEHAREQIRLYGADNPWVLVSIFGKFPPAAFNVLIGPDEVSDAMKRYHRDHEIGDAARVMGVDVAEFGDDESVIARRRGIQMLPFLSYRNLNSTQGAGQVSRAWNEFDADACFIDATGGFGAGWIDQLALVGKSAIRVHFGQKANAEERYANRRAEMYFLFVQWIKDGGALPLSNNLLAALTSTTYAFQRDRLILEPKADVKTKIGFSPDEADAAALTFAEPVNPKVQSVLPGMNVRSAADPNYRPFRIQGGGGTVENSAAGRYDPYSSIRRPR